MRRDSRTTIRRVLITIIILIVVGYIIFNSRFLITGPQIEVIYPPDGASLSERLIEIRGETRNIAYISLNDHPIFVDEEGNFSEKLLLSPGLSIIELYGNDRFDRETTEYLQYVYTEP